METAAVGPDVGGGVLVSHPGRQHSHQAAMALSQAGMLAGYWAGVPSHQDQQAWIPRRWRERYIRYAPIAIPEGRARWLPIAVSLRRLGRLSRTKWIEQPIDFLACRAFDRQVARRLEATGARAVIACEISALETFRLAKRLGMCTILDAPSVHFSTQDRISPSDERPWLHQRIVEVKHAELALADHVITVSSLARDTYLEAGVASARVHAVALGADTRLFISSADSADRRLPTTPFTFVFAGATLHRKGVDILIDAFEKLQERMPGCASLVFIGTRGDAHHRIERCRVKGIMTRPPVKQSDLQKAFSAADCFVLPSRHDSFGMVVAEAMACGLPAIVSTMVGAKDLIEEGASGWVVPVADAGALAERMAWCVEHRDAVRAMGPAARAAAERHDWESYRARFSTLIRQLVS